MLKLDYLLNKLIKVSIIKMKLEEGVQTIFAKRFLYSVYLSLVSLSLSTAQLC